MGGVILERPGGARRVVDVPVELGELNGHYRAGRMPYPIAGVLEVAEAAAVARALPAPRNQGSACPVGYGVLPPVRAEPVVTLGKPARDGYGVQIPAGAHGVLGALWSHPSGRVVFRLWFRSEQKGHQGKLLRGPVDCFEDAIGGVRGLEGVVPQWTGWEICRLDHGAETADEDLDRSKAGLVDRHGKPFSDAEAPG